MADNQRPTCIAESMDQHAESDADNDFYTEEHQRSSKATYPTQICFGSWSAAFEEGEIAMPPPKILIGRGLRSRPQAILASTDSYDDVVCEISMDIVATGTKLCPLPSTRSWHNRRVGHSLLESEGNNRNRSISIARPAEFETFLKTCDFFE
jgi:hypothetical protein